MRSPDIFELSEIDGHSSVIKEEVSDDQQDEAVEAVRSCPERAIFIS
jgi:ferredoxin